MGAGLSELVISLDGGIPRLSLHSIGMRSSNLLPSQRL